MQPLDIPFPLQAVRVNVRPLRASDLPIFTQYRADPVVAKYQGWSPMDESQALAFLIEMSTCTRLLPGEWIQLGIALAESDLLAGDIGIFLDRNQEAAEVGFTLARQHQGHGLASEAVDLAVEAIFASSRVTKVQGITDARNRASMKLLQRLGFIKVSEHTTTFKGEICDEYVYEKSRNNS